MRRGKVDVDLADLEPVLAGVLELVVEVGGVEQRFGGDAAPVQTGSPEKRILLDDCGRESKQPRADGGNVTSGPTSDDDDLERLQKNSLLSPVGSGLSVWTVGCGLRPEGRAYNEADSVLGTFPRYNCLGVRRH